MKYILIIRAITIGYIMIDAELYRVFSIVARCNTISAAALQLHISQPAVSKSIKKLEYLTGCTLFQRSSKGVCLTSEGKLLYEYVREGFSYLEGGEQILKKIRNREQGLVSVGISNTLCKYFFIPHLEAFHQKYPGIRITIVNRTSTETMDLLERGVIDFGVISLPRDCSRFQIYELFRVQDIFVASGKCAAISEPLPAAELSNYPIMMLEKDNVTRSYIDEYLRTHHISLNPEIEIGSLEFLVEFARIGLGISLVIRNFIEKELNEKVLVEIPVVPAIPQRRIGIVTLKNLPLSIAAESFISLLCAAVKH